MGSAEPLVRYREFQRLPTCDTYRLEYRIELNFASVGFGVHLECLEPNIKIQNYSFISVDLQYNPKIFWENTKCYQFTLH
jgi:hypothetical protein